jgi:broad specificity phosphatase PhoE
MRAYTCVTLVLLAAACAEAIPSKVCARIEGIEATTFFQLPVCRVKIIHLVRHGLALHNIASKGCDDEDVFDPPLVALGKLQAEELGHELAKDGGVRIDAIVTSPLRRTLQTTLFLRNAQAARNDGRRVAAVFVMEDVREHYSGCTDNMRMNSSDAMSSFPDYHFDSFASELDPFWFLPGGGVGGYEEYEAMWRRAARVVGALHQRPEANIVVVSHATFISSLIRHMSEVEQGWTRVVPSGLPNSTVYDQGPHFKNCQVASYEWREQ